MKTKQINSIKDPAFEELRRSRTLSGRQQHGTFAIESEAMISQALDAGYAIKALYSTSPSIHLKMDEQAPVYEISKGMMAKVFGSETPSMAALAFKKEVALDALKSKKLILVLDQIQNCNNMGMLFRSAEALGVDGVIIIPHPTADLYDRSTVKSSMGSFFRLPMNISTTEESLAFFKINNIEVISTQLGAPVSLEDLPKKPQATLVVGNETNGISEAFAQGADTLVSIPMKGKIQSLNVVVAASLCLYHLSMKHPAR